MTGDGTLTWVLTVFFLFFFSLPPFCIFFAVCDVNLEKIIIPKKIIIPRHATIYIYSFPPLEMHRGEKHTTVCVCWVLEWRIHFFFDFCILYLDFISFSFLCYFFVLLLLILSWVQFVFLWFNKFLSDFYKASLFYFLLFPVFCCCVSPFLISEVHFVFLRYCN